jgi:hypothetical protein
MFHNCILIPHTFSWVMFKLFTCPLHVWCVVLTALLGGLGILWSEIKNQFVLDNDIMLAFNFTDLNLLFNVSLFGHNVCILFLDIEDTVSGGCILHCTTSGGFYTYTCVLWNLGVQKMCRYITFETGFMLLYVYLFLCLQMICASCCTFMRI